MSESFDPSRVTQELGVRWKIGENCYKLHSCCGHTHTAIDAALELRERVNGAAVIGVEIETYGPGFEIVKEENPGSAYQAKFSIAYCVAAALVEGAVGLDQFSSDRFGVGGVRDAAICRVLDGTKVRVAEDLSAKYPAAWPARVRVTLEDGTEMRAAADYPRGNPENAVSTEELEEKFRGLVGTRFGEHVAERALRALRSIENCEDMASAFRGLVV
jgi:2-methylcitrate dehydratase PrpD